MFWKSSNQKSPLPSSQTEFSYLSLQDHYFDTACQTLRPQSVIDAECAYYTQNNACGGRSSYQWAKMVDQRISLVRRSFLDVLGLSTRDYVTFFGLNTTQSINTLLWALPWDEYDTIITSDIEHNSVFLPVMKVAQKLSKRRHILERDEQGALLYEKTQLTNAVIIINTTSNIDGRELLNREQLIQDAHAEGGVVILDACQTLGHNPQMLSKTQADAILGSGHKMYGPSLGIGAIRRSLAEKLDPLTIGGGTVSGVSEHRYTLLSGDDLPLRLEAGLQQWAGIWAMKETLEFLKQADWHQERAFATQVHKLLQKSGATVLSQPYSSVQTCYFPHLESSLVGDLLAKKNIMVRTGYFCCHYYLTEKHPLPHLVRISLGQHTQDSDIEALEKSLQTIQALR